MKVSAIVRVTTVSGGAASLLDADIHHLLALNQHLEVPTEARVLSRYNTSASTCPAYNVAKRGSWIQLPQAPLSKLWNSTGNHKIDEDEIWWLCK